eukprot:c21417_g2_i1.p1 GENE.c21417_g2_i1~~c21417_g2_i1.p1  ORF type:complete len:877 (+),score=355.32 c21417_g2_i1:145-2775(+)
MSQRTYFTKFLKDGIEKFLGIDITSFTIIEKEGDQIYVCFSKKAFLLVDFNPPQTKEQQNFASTCQKYYYAWIEDIICDDVDPKLFMIRLKDGKESIFLSSATRDQVIEEFHIGWRTDYMIRKWEICKFPVKKGDILSRRVQKILTDTDKPQPGYKVHHNGHYTFHLPNQFVPSTHSAITQHFLKPSTIGLKENKNIAGKAALDVLNQAKYKAGLIFKMMAFCVPSAAVELGDYWQVLEMEREHVIRGGAHFAKSSLKDATELHARMLASRDLGVSRTRFSRSIQKTVNLSGDVANYTCHLTRIATEKRDIVVLIIRRNYIPPIGDYFQDLIFCYHGAVEMEAKVSDEDMYQMFCGIVDSVQPTKTMTFYDDTAAEVRCQGLLFDEDSYVWFDSQGFTAIVKDAGIALFKCICDTLVKKKQGIELDLKNVYPTISTIQDPFDIINDMEQDAPGLDLDSPNIYWRCWKDKLARYFAFVLDGGIHPDAFNLETVAELVLAQDKLDSKEIKNFRRLFDYLLHLRAPSKDYNQNTVTIEKLVDPQLLLDFVCNERVLGTLLRSGYISVLFAELGDRSDQAYVKFLHLLLQRRKTTIEVAFQAAQQIADLSSLPENRKFLSNMSDLILTLIDFLRLNEERLLLPAAMALANLTEQNPKVKTLVVLENAMQHIVHQAHLTTKNDRVVQALCVLIKNCLNTEEAIRQKVAREGLAKPLIAILKNKPPVEIASKCAAAVWNLCGSVDGRENVNAESGVNCLSILLCEATNIDVVEKAAGALMMLCASNDRNKREAVELGVVESCISWLLETDGIVFRNLCGLLSVMSYESTAKTIISANSEGVAKVIEKAQMIVSQEQLKGQPNQRLSNLSDFVLLLRQNIAVE